ncbi:MAG: hypothetical protein GF353_12405 [Candidatus Lokiarchaeota archaeon]|nr:hypothetical protein [Candidatus Lokiarchaeota archaeon]
METQNVSMEMKKENIEKSTHTVWLEKKSLRIVLISMFSALNVVVGYLLVFIPNIEIFTLMIFLSGFILGKRDGAIVGAMSAFVFVFFNPLGISPLPLFAYQLAHYTFVGFLGALSKQYLHHKDYFQPHEDLYAPRILILFGFIGAVITFVFDIISTWIGFVFFYADEPLAFWSIYLFGLPFTTIHIIGNTLGFIFILPGLIQLLYKLLEISK